MNGHTPVPRSLSQADADQSADWLPVERPLEAIVEDMRHVRDNGVIALYCGEAHPDVYGARTFIETAHDMVEVRKARITAITGPVLLVPDDEHEQHGLLQLLKGGKLTGLYHRRARFATGHFRVVETDGYFRYYREHTHLPVECVEDRTCENLLRLTPEEVHVQAKDALKSFHQWKSLAVRHDQARAENLPLISTPSKLKELVENLTERGIDFNYLGPHEIVQEASKVKKGLVAPLSDFRLKR